MFQRTTEKLRKSLQDYRERQADNQNYPNPNRLVVVGHFADGTPILRKAFPMSNSGSFQNNF